MHEFTDQMLIERIRGAGLKVTAPRLAVLRAIDAGPHSDAETVFGQVKTDLPGTSLQAVYGVLTALTTAGLLRKFESAGSAGRYERYLNDNHHHMICTSCKSVQDVPCVVGQAPCFSPAANHGFAVAIAEVTFWGLCPACQLQPQTL